MPLTVRQIHSMQSLQAHAPEMKEIQRKYKGDRAKMNEEMMKFYKENHINPAASCLPMIAQLPVFISLYLVLKNFSKHVPPGADLSWLHIVPNITDKANSCWAGYLLLAVYAFSQAFSTYFMSATMDKTQRRLMMLLPLVFITVIAHFKIGLVIYWVTTNLWTVGPGADHAPARARAPPPALAPLRRRRPPARRLPRGGDAGNGAKTEPPPPKQRPPAQVAAAPRQAEQGRRPAVSDELTVEGTGETRRRGEVERPARARARSPRRSTRPPSASRCSRRAERGLLGVGYEPVRVLASAAEAPTGAGDRRGRRERRGPAPPRAARARRGRSRPSLPDRDQRDGVLARRDLPRATTSGS